MCRRVIEQVMQNLKGTVAEGRVSYADLIALGGAYAVSVTGGPVIDVPIGVSRKVPMLWLSKQLTRQAVTCGSVQMGQCADGHVRSMQAGRTQRLQILQTGYQLKHSQPRLSDSTLRPRAFLLKSSLPCLVLTR